MSQRSAAAASPHLFARKGTARPGDGAGPEDIGDSPERHEAERHGDSAPQENGKTSGAKARCGPEAGPGSLHSIVFRRPRLAGELSEPPGETRALRNGARPPVAQAARSGARATANSNAVLLILLAVVCFGVGLWYALFSEDSGARQAIPAAQLEDPVSDPKPAAQDDARAEPTAPPTAPPTGGGEAASAESPTPQPSFDLIRIEPGGEAVIAGRAAPNTELILLDNGQPIGKVTADGAGEWAFVPEAPLAPGDHEFGLVIVTPHGTVAVPAVGRPDDEGASLAPPEVNGEVEAKPNGESADLADAPLSGALAALKTPSSAARSYVIQLSSTTSRRGAEQEWRKLKRTFPGLLGDKELNVQQAVLDPGGTRYRVRTGRFAEKASARALCSEFRAKRQDCLVIER
jgi:hypothetical protein